MELISEECIFMNPAFRNTPTPQMGFDFLLAVPAEAYINKPGGHSAIELDAQVPIGGNAGDALSRMVVQDRALGLGITNWRVLIESALSTGHTELYSGEGNSQGLRKPGLRFGPIACMPDIGPAYVKRSLFSKLLAKAAKLAEPVKSGRILSAAAVKIECILAGDAIAFNFYDARKNVGAVSICPADLPFTGGDQAEDSKTQIEFLAKRFQSELLELGDSFLLAAGALQSLGLALKSLEC
jgi:hypothetical protein